MDATYWVAPCGEQPPLGQGEELLILPEMVTTSSRPAWLKSPTARATPPPGEVTGARKLGTERSSRASRNNRLGVGFRGSGVGRVRRRASREVSHMIRLLS